MALAPVSARAASPAPRTASIAAAEEVAPRTQSPSGPPKDTRLALASPNARHGASANTSASAGAGASASANSRASPNASSKDETRIDRRPTESRDDLTLAGEAMAVGRTSDAITLLRKVIQAEPENERARQALLYLLGERGRDDLWRAALADSARAMPRRFGLVAAQGLAETGHFADSLGILKSLPAAVRDSRYYSALGATHQQLNQHAEAVAAFESALGLASGSSPQLPSLLVAQAVSMQSLGRPGEARRNLERVREMPDAAPEVREFANRALAQAR
jgi:tetratricopeptide (TPR) repeat protein